MTIENNTGAPCIGEGAALLLLERGFAALAWGLFVTVTLFAAQAFLILDMLGLQVPAYVFGTLLTGWGGLCIYEYAESRNCDARALRILLLLTVIQLYLAPFIVWHRNLPLAPFFWGNFLVLMLVLLLTMAFVNITAAQVLHRLNQQVVARRALWLAGIITLTGICWLAVIAWDIWFTYNSPGGIIAGRLWMVLRYARWWIWLFLLAPASITILACYWGRAAAARGLHDFTGEPRLDVTPKNQG